MRKVLYKPSNRTTTRIIREADFEAADIKPPKEGDVVFNKDNDFTAELTNAQADFLLGLGEFVDADSPEAEEETEGETEGDSEEVPTVNPS